MTNAYVNGSTISPLKCTDKVPVHIVAGDAREKLGAIPDESIQCCVTSPPYWGMRDYGYEGQIGAEGTIGEYISSPVSCFSEVRRVGQDR